MFSESDSICFRRKLMMPSNSTSGVFPFFAFVSSASSSCLSVPYSKACSTSAGRSLSGVERLSLKAFRKDCSSLKIQMSRNSPSGAMPPRLMLSFLSGMMVSSVIS